MSKYDYKQDAQKIIHALGGKSNIKRVFHCMTRVRVYVKNEKLVDAESIAKLPEVAGTTWNNEQFQIIVGTYVGGIYDALVDLGVPNDDVDTSDMTSNSNNGTIMSKIVEAITGCMTPLIPALTAAGMIKVVLALCTTFNWVSQTSSTFQVISFMADAMYYFLPFFVAANAAKVFRVNQSLALLIAGVFLHPNFVKMMAAKAPILFFGAPVYKYDYSYSVIPILLMVWLMSYISKFSKKVSPDIIRLIMEPTLTIVVSAPLALLIVGPIGGVIGEGLAIVIKFLSAHLGFVIVGLLAAAFPYIVMTGMHHALTPIGLNAVATGGDTLIFVSQVCSNVAQAGAALAVAVKSKNKNMKQLGSATGISALMGITEPALYGVTLKLKKPLLAATIAAGVGGIIGGILQVTLYIPQNCLLALPAFIGGKKPWINFAFGSLMILVSFVMAFILTLVFGFKENQQSVKNAKKSVNTADAVIIEKPATVSAPVEGQLESLTSVPDRTFSEKMMGDGVAINPSNGVVRAPADATVISIMDTKHGIILQLKNGAQILIHIGLDTVNLKGKYFESTVKNGDKVKKGDILIRFDKKQILAAGYNLITPIIVLNTSAYNKIQMEDKGEVTFNDIVLDLN
jgi:PTS system, beta-glucoside-specific, IIABC component